MFAQLTLIISLTLLSTSDLITMNTFPQMKQIGSIFYDVQYYQVIMFVVQNIFISLLKSIVILVVIEKYLVKISILKSTFMLVALLIKYFLFNDLWNYRYYFLHGATGSLETSIIAFLLIILFKQPQKAFVSFFPIFIPALATAYSYWYANKAISTKDIYFENHSQYQSQIKHIVSVQSLVGIIGSIGTILTVLYLRERLENFYQQKHIQETIKGFFYKLRSMKIAQIFEYGKLNKKMKMSIYNYLILFLWALVYLISQSIWKYYPFFKLTMSQISDLEIISVICTIILACLMIFFKRFSQLSNQSLIYILTIVGLSACSILYFLQSQEGILPQKKHKYLQYNLILINAAFTLFLPVYFDQAKLSKIKTLFFILPIQVYKFSTVSDGHPDVLGASERHYTCFLFWMVSFVFCGYLYLKNLKKNLGLDYNADEELEQNRSSQMFEEQNKQLGQQPWQRETIGLRPNL